MKDEIIGFFDGMAPNRDEKIESDPILDYEQRMRRLQIAALVEIDDADLVLDAGCGNLRDANLVVANKDAMYIGIDISSGMLKEGRRKYLTNHLHLAQGDIVSLPFRTGAFDLVLCSERR